LWTVYAYKKHPYIIRSDRGVETPVFAEVHYALSCLTQPQIPFNKVYYYGKSTDNVRIESWWSQLEKSKLGYWRVSSL